MRYLGVGKQTGFGSAVAPTKFIDVLSFSITPNEERIFQPTISRREPVMFFPGQKFSESEFESYLWPEGGWEWILLSFFQKATTTTLDSTNGVYQHVYTPALFDDPVTYFTLEGGYDDVTALRAGDNICDSLEFTFTADEPPSASLSLVGASPATVSAATPSYPAVRAFQNPDISLLVGGSAADLRELSIEAANNLERFHNLSQALKRIDLTNLEVSGSLSTRFRNTTQLNNFLNGTETSIKITLTGPLAGGTHNYKLELDLPRVVYSAWSADVDAADLLVEDVEFTAVKPTTGDILKATLVNKVASL